MPLVNAALTELAKLTVDDSPTAFDNANAYLGVGDSNAAFSAAQTDLQGTSQRNGMATSYPRRSGAAMSFRAIYASSEANFAWQEWAVFNASSGGTMLQREVAALGTKPSNESWVLTVTLTFQVGA